MDSSVKTITDISGLRRVFFFRRDDGSYGFEEQHFGVEEQAWYPAKRMFVTFTATLAEARKEAAERISWLAKLGDEVIEA